MVQDSEVLSEVLLEPGPFEDTEVRLSPGDELEIKFFHTPELNTIQTIRPDGKIAMQLIGEIMAKGLTPNQLKEGLLKQYSKYLLQIDVTVIVRTFSSRVVYVGPGVDRPGAVPFSSHMTVLDALMLAGGVRSITATTSRLKFPKVMLIRKQDGKWVGMELDLEKILSGEQTQPYYLKPSDLIFVPEAIRY